MAYRVDLTDRAVRDLKRIYHIIHAEDSSEARAWFAGLKQAILSLEQYPARSSALPEDTDLRHLLYGRKPNVYRIIYAIDERHSVVTVLHIRHGARDAFARQQQ